MKQIVWELRLTCLPQAGRYCKKCGEKTSFLCSGQFRVNAQKKLLDIWLIYKCARCDTTWNAAVLSRVSPQALDPCLLEGFLQNDPSLVRRYAADVSFLQKNGAQIILPDFELTGEVPPSDEKAEITIKTEFPLPLRVSALIRKKLLLSQKEFEALADSGRLAALSPQNLKKCRLQGGITLLLSPAKS